MADKAKALRRWSIITGSARGVELLLDEAIPESSVILCRKAKTIAEFPAWPMARIERWPRRVLKAWGVRGMPVWAREYEPMTTATPRLYMAAMAMHPDTAELLIERLA